MKYLKKFNEELKPETYKSAGSSLLRKGHTSRGIRLSQYGHDLAGDLISFWVGSISPSGSSSTKQPHLFHLPLEFEYKSCKVSFNDGQSYYHVYPNGTVHESLSNDVSQLVECYKKGRCDLYFDVQLSFKISPRQKELFSDLSKKIAARTATGGVTGMHDDYIIKELGSDYRGELPLISFRVYISETIYNEDPENGDEIPLSPENFYNDFKNMFDPRAYISKGEDLVERIYNRNNNTAVEIKREILGIPCSRIEANKIKKMIIPKVINSISPVVHELFSEHIQSDPEDYEKTISAIRNIKTNDLYKDKVSIPPYSVGYEGLFRSQFYKR